MSSPVQQFVMCAAVGAIAAFPIPLSEKIAFKVQRHFVSSIAWTSSTTDDMIVSRNSLFTKLKYTRIIAGFVGKALAIAALSTFLALSIITGPIGIGFAVAGIAILGLFVLYPLAKLIGDIANKNEIYNCFTEMCMRV